MANVNFADLLEEEHITTSWLLSRAVGVITTPSTIALDGTLANVPVTVCRYGLDLVTTLLCVSLMNLETGKGFWNLSWPKRNTAN